MKKNISIYLILLFVVIFSTSCLRHNLPSYPTWNKAKINRVSVEYRYKGDQKYHGKPIVDYEKLIVDQTIDSVNSTVSLKITVPSASGSFTDSVRNKVSQDHLWVYMDIPTAASIKSMGSTPELGYATDLTKPQNYVVTAASGKQRKWTLKVTSFKK